MILLLALLLPLQDPSIVVRPDPPADDAWSVKATGPFPGDVSICILLRRIERVWDPGSGKFLEVPSDEVRRRAPAQADQRGLKASLKPGPAGLYQLLVQSDEQTVFETRTPFGHIGPLFASSSDAARTLAALALEAGEHLDEIERLSKAPQARLFQDFQRRIARHEKMLRDASKGCDLTATSRLLREIYYQLRNAQVAPETDPPGVKDNDGPARGQGIFLDSTSTVQSLQKRISSVKTVLSQEIRLSIASLLEGAFALDPSRAREVAADAVKLARAAPEPSADFIKALETRDRGALRDVRASLLKE
ncbi:MAG: hypothetical protein HYY16_03815 [Planctomycetes bacterium]|nr:hypothetical protein [Planctomycetota bacterium]